MDKENGNRSKKKWSFIFKQFFICSAASVMSSVYGMSMGAPTVIIPYMRNHANMTVSDEMASWTSSILNMSGTAWVVVLATLSHYIGRKKTTLFSSLVSSLAFIGLYCSVTINHVFVCEVILGVNAASLITLSIMINSEYSDAKYRGMLDTIKGASFFWGVLLANAIGTFVHWRNIGLLGLLSSVYTFSVALYMPESPVWLASRGMFEKCSEVHRWMKGSDKNASEELDKIIQNHKGYKEENSQYSSMNIFKKYFQIIKTNEIKRAVGCGLLLNFLYDWCGKLICTVYAVDILIKITNDEYLAYMSMLVIDAVTVLGMYLSSILVKTAKRKTLQISATVACIVTLFIMSSYLYLAKLALIPENSYVIVSLIVIYSIFVCAGPIMMCMIILAEIIPIRHRTFSFLLISIITKASKGFFLKIAPYLLSAFDVHGTFLFFAICSLILEYFICTHLPETKDKTLDEIAKSFRGEYEEVSQKLLMITKADPKTELEGADKNVK